VLEVVLGRSWDVAVIEEAMVRLEIVSCRLPHYQTQVQAQVNGGGFPNREDSEGYEGSKEFRGLEA